MKKELDIATDEECVERRNELIRAGIIKPNSKNSLRKNLINKGIIEPNPSYPLFKSNKTECPDEGEYSVKPIENEEEYNRKKDMYLWMVHDILRTRKKLKLIFKVNNNESDWYF